MAEAILRGAAVIVGAKFKEEKLQNAIMIGNEEVAFLFHILDDPGY